MKKLALLVVLSQVVVFSAYAGRRPASQSCAKNIAKATLDLDSKLGFSNQGCRVSYTTSAFGVGFGIVGESTVSCDSGIDDQRQAKLEEQRIYSFHLAPGGCNVQSIVPKSAPPAALE